MIHIWRPLGLGDTEANFMCQFQFGAGTKHGESNGAEWHLVEDDMRSHLDDNTKTWGGWGMQDVLVMPHMNDI